MNLFEFLESHLGIKGSKIALSQDGAIVVHIKSVEELSLFRGILQKEDLKFRLDFDDPNAKPYLFGTQVNFSEHPFLFQFWKGLGQQLS